MADKADLRGAKFGGGLVIGDGIQVGGKLVDKSVNFSGSNTESIMELVAHLRDLTQSFPQDQKEEAEIDLDDLEQEIQQSGEANPKRLRKRLKGLLATAGALTIGISSATANISETSQHIVDFSDDAKVFVESQPITAAVAGR
jgi:hypothetical protein